MDDLATLIERTFGAVRIINLPTRSDRRSETSRELARIGMAADGGAIAYFDAFRPAGAAGFETVGTHGCFLSHMGVIEEAAAAGRGVLLLEDDIALAPQAGERLRQVATALAAERWDIFYGGWDKIAVADLPMRGSLRLVPPDKGVLTAHCVAFSATTTALLAPYLRAMLARPAGSAEGGPMHVDGGYAWFRRQHPTLITLLADPPIATQRSSRTDIHDLALYDRVPVLRDLAQAARRLRACVRA